jgi:hypothetical protein
MTLLTSAGRRAATAGGQTLRAATAALAALRPADKPLHPVGSVTRGTLHRSGSDARSGVAWLDEPGEDEVLVRLSRAAGLPAPLPDVFGLALRVSRPDGYGDLLFSTTGRGRLTRFTLTPGRTPYSRPMTTLLPYRTPAGPVLVGAVLRDESVVDLSWAAGTGPWHRFGVLRLSQEPAGDEDVSFDPVRHALPGLETYGWVRRLREPSYLTARRSRGLTR